MFSPRDSPVTAAKGSMAMTARKILLVDDSETILQMEQMILAKEPYELLVARDGAEGVARALESTPDLILMDVVMPRMGGFEALRQLRGNQRTSAVPVVMVTTKAEADSIETGYASGCNDYIVKPIDSTELIAKVRDLLGD
jgi:DNA-binding response OmpR family regulator